MFAACGGADDRDALILQELGRKSCVLFADIGKRGDRLGAAEDLRLQPVAPCTLLQQTVDQQFHQVNAISSGIAAGCRRAARTGKQEMIHSSNPGHGITKTGGHAGSQYGRKDHIGIIHNLVLALNDMNPLYGGDIVHLRAPNTASIAAFIFSMVKGFASTLLAPSCAAFWTSARSP